MGANLCDECRPSPPVHRMHNIRAVCAAVVEIQRGFVLLTMALSDGSSEAGILFGLGVGLWIYHGFQVVLKRANRLLITLRKCSACLSELHLKQHYPAFPGKGISKILIRTRIST